MSTNETQNGQNAHNSEMEKYLDSLPTETAAVQRIAIELFNQTIEHYKSIEKKVSTQDQKILWTQAIKTAEVQRIQDLDAMRVSQNMGNSKRHIQVEFKKPEEKISLVRQVQTEVIVGKGVSGKMVAKANALITDIHKQMAGLTEINFFDSGFDLFKQVEDIIKNEAIPINNLSMGFIDFDSRVKDFLPATNWFDLRTRYYTTLAQRLTFLYFNNSDFKAPTILKVLEYLYSCVYQYKNADKTELKYLDLQTLGFVSEKEMAINPQIKPASDEHIETAKQYLNIINSQMACETAIDFFDLSYSYDYFKLLAKMVADKLVCPEHFGMIPEDFDSRDSDLDAPANWLDLRTRYYTTLSHRVTVLFYTLEEYKRNLIFDNTIKYLYSRVYSCNATLQIEQVNKSIKFSKHSSVSALRSAKLKEIIGAQKLWHDISTSDEDFPAKYDKLFDKIFNFDISAEELKVNKDEFYRIIDKRLEKQMEKSFLLSNIDIGISDNKIQRAKKEAVSEEVYRARVIWREIKEKYDDFPAKFSELMGLMNLHDISVEELLEHEETFRNLIEIRKMERKGREIDSFAKPKNVSLIDILGKPQQEAEATVEVAEEPEVTVEVAEEPEVAVDIAEELEVTVEVAQELEVAVEVAEELEVTVEVAQEPEVAINVTEEPELAEIKALAEEIKVNQEIEDPEPLTVIHDTEEEPEEINTSDSTKEKKGWLSRLAKVFTQKGDDSCEKSTNEEEVQVEITPKNEDTAEYLDDVKIIKKDPKESKHNSNSITSSADNSNVSSLLVRDISENLSTVISGKPEDEDTGESSKKIIIESQLPKTKSFEDAIRLLIKDNSVNTVDSDKIVRQFSIAKNKYKSFNQACKYMDDKIKGIDRHLSFFKVFGHTSDIKQKLKQTDQFVFNK